MQNTLGSNVETMYRLIENKVEALEFRIKNESMIVGKSLESLKIKKGILIACISHKGKIIRPNGQTQISVGDTVIVVTTHQGLRDINDIIER
jgi:trk system potassium uptake protein TrkA